MATAQGTAVGAATAADPGLRYHRVTSSDGLVLNVAETGPREAPAVLLLHGSGQSLLSWRRQLESPLATRLRLVAPDLRAHGDSGKPAANEAYSEACRWAEDLRAVQRALQLERPVFVAWSFGGLVAMHYVRCLGTEGMAGLVLVASSGGGLVPSASRGTSSALTATREMGAADLRTNLRGARAFAALMTARPPDAEWEQETVAALLRVPAYARRAMAGGQTGPDGAKLVNHEDLIPRVAALPLLVVVGGSDALMDGAALARTYRERFPRARVETYADSGHSPFAEEPDRFNRDLERFVREAGNAAKTAR